jgi:hypothetical protein
MAVCQEWDKQDFDFQKHIFGKSRFTQWALKQFLFDEMRRIDNLLWKIVEYRAGLLWMFNNVYEFCCFNLILRIKNMHFFLFEWSCIIKVPISWLGILNIFYLWCILWRNAIYLYKKIFHLHRIISPQSYRIWHQTGNCKLDFFCFQRIKFPVWCHIQ